MSLDMADSDRAAAVRNFWESIQARNWDAARSLLADGCVVEWPHSRERFDGGDAYIEMNRAYPEGWRITVMRVVADGDQVASEIRVEQGGDVYFAASFFEFGPDGSVLRLREHWVTSPYEEPADWRARWSRPLDV
ncbi:MAG: nuclear transport factor 2 family protein [Actinomycetota bacterium]